MGIIKEPLDVDFVVENRSLTKEEEKQISEYILSQKKKKENKNISNPRVNKAKQKA
jgi:hypothetical protein